MADYNKTREKRENIWLIKSDKKVKNIIDEIRIERIKKGLDNDLIPYSEIINASFRFDPLKEILKKAKIKRREDE